MHIQPIKTKIFKEGDDLISFITLHLKSLRERSILAVTSKIVALSEGRTVDSKNSKEKEEVIKRESEWVKETKHVWLTYTKGMYMANAGIDESNANGQLILLPKDCWRAAEYVRKQLRGIYRVKKIGVVITDSRTLPLRRGVIGVALGFAGFSGIRDYRGKKDLFQRKFKYSTANLADGIAAAAVLVMGEGKEQVPLALVTDAPVEFVSKRINAKDVTIPLKEDMYFPLLDSVLKKKKTRDRREPRDS